MPEPHAAHSGRQLIFTLARSESLLCSMKIIPTYEDIDEIHSFPENRRFDEFKKADHELKSSSENYRKTCRSHNWAMIIVLAVGLIPMPFAFTHPMINLFVSFWSILGTILLLGIAYNAQRFVNAEIGRYLRKENANKTMELTEKG